MRKKPGRSSENTWPENNLSLIQKLTTTGLGACISVFLSAQNLLPADGYLIFNAGPGDPVYTTYTAAPARSSLYDDKGYTMLYDDFSSPLTYGSEHGGKFFTLWEINNVVVSRIGEYHIKPIVKASFPDLAVLEYEPWPGISVEEIFFVYNSNCAVVDCHLKNNTPNTHEINIYPVLEDADSLQIIEFNSASNSYCFNHYETKKRLISNLSDKYPYPDHFYNLFSAGFPIYSYGAYQGDRQDLYNAIKTDFYSENRSDSLNLADSSDAGFIALHGKYILEPGATIHYRYCRLRQSRDKEPERLGKILEDAKSLSIQPFIDENVRLFSNIPRIDFSDPADKMVYLSAFNLARGCFLPAEGQTTHNYYVFSREPLWGWGHGHQVLHESLSMLAYAYLDPVSAQNSQRVYMEQQGKDGLIAYRHGPRGPQTYPHKELPTTSAPFYSWINLEIYNVSHDREFLADAYESGTRYARWLINNRDTDHDGTFEWGPYGIIENVRDWYNAVFQVSKERYLDIDKEDISDELECLDLSLMMVKEMRSLATMATALDLPEESEEWEGKAEKLAGLINERMWDDASGFYYSVDKTDHSFYFMTRDLKRQEIIGFLPLWAEVADSTRAVRLVQTLTDPGKFWRKYGVPTLAADDEWYSPYVDYCCKWNGPVWLLWDYMVYEGLRNYGYDSLAEELAVNLLGAVKVQLSRNHRFPESYSPDNEVLNCPPNYIWDSIIARLMIRMNSD